MPHRKSTFERAVTNEGWLFVNRMFWTLGIGYGAIQLSAIATGTADLRKDFNEFKEKSATQVALTAGEVTLLKDRVNAQSDRITGVQADLREVWRNIRDLLSRKP